MGPKLQIRGRKLYWLVQIVCGVSFMMYGYDAGVLGGVIEYKPFLDAIGNPTGKWVIPMIGSAYSLAGTVTSVATAFFAFRIGRRGVIILGNAVAIVGSIIQATSWSVAQLIVGRVLTGFAIGCISSAVPTYINETGAEKGDRGPANAFNAILLITGVPIAYWVDYGFTQLGTQAGWRIPIALQCVFAIISGGTMIFLPDTPRFYYAKGRNEEGDRALMLLNDADIDSEKVQATRLEIMVSIEAELEATSSLDWKQFLTFGLTDKTPMKIVRRLCICFWMPMIREWMGSSLVAYWAIAILNQVGAEKSLVTILAGVIGICFAAGCVPLYFTVEKVGRRNVLMYGAMSLSVLMLIFTVLNAVPQTGAIGWASIVIIFMFVFVFGYSWQGAVWLYCSEIAPLEYRHIGGAMCATGEWLMTFITVFAGPIGLNDCGWRFWIFVLVGNLVGVAFIFFLCPETSGLTLEEIDFIFTKGAQNADFLQHKQDIEARVAGGKEVNATKVLDVVHKE